MTGAVLSAVGGLGPSTMLGIITELGLTSGLLLCLDAADSASYSGAGQVWLDRSGNTYDFNRGDTGGAEATDPTFNGTAGGLSANEYWSFDGGDYFEYDSAVETWMSNLHKDNALYTIVQIFWGLSGEGNGGLYGTVDNGQADGIEAFWFSTGGGNVNVTHRARGGAGSIVYSTTTGGGKEDGWSFWAIALDEAAGASGASIRLNATTANDFTATYASPSAEAAQPMVLGALNVQPDVPAPNTARLAAHIVWSSRLSNTSLTNLYNRIKQRRPGYGLP